MKSILLSLLCIAVLVQATSADSPCEINVTKDGVTREGTIVDVTVLVNGCKGGVRVTGDPAVFPGWSAVRDELSRAAIPIALERRLDVVVWGAGWIGSKTKDALGQVGASVVGKRMQLGVVQPFASFDGERTRPAAGFRNLRLGARFDFNPSPLRLQVAAWLAPPTSKKVVDSRDSGVLGMVSLMAAVSKRVEFGVEGRAARRDDWLELDLFEVTYADMSMTASFMDRLSVSAGLAQIYRKQVRLVPHAQLEGRWDPWGALWINFVRDEQTTNVLVGLRLGFGQNVHGGWQSVR